MVKIIKLERISLSKYLNIKKYIYSTIYKTIIHR